MIDKKIYFIDTAPFIYFIEGNSKDAYDARDMFYNLINKNNQLITSVITDLEFKVLPKRMNQMRKIRNFDFFLDEYGIERKTITKKTLEIALDIRVSYKSIKLIDAIQLAIALENDCDIFITNDKQLLQYEGIECKLFNDINWKWQMYMI